MLHLAGGRVAELDQAVVLEIAEEVSRVGQGDRLHAGGAPQVLGGHG